MEKRKIAILIPAHNEEKVIAKTIASVVEVADKQDIYLVNDGSKDETDAIARRLLSNVLTFPKGHGKAGAMNLAMKHFDLPNRYEYLMPIDADTIITKDFIKNALPVLENDTGNKIACVVGKVTGIHVNWITAYRMWEYEVAQTVHKTAQTLEDSVMICPGCSTIYRASIFQKITVPTGTLTEDMDLTFLIHRKKLGKIVYVGNAKVVTQDPASIRDVYKQLNRWYTGFWQCLIKHHIPWGGQMLDFEVGIVALEGLFNGFLVLSLLFLLPFILKTNPMLAAIPALVDLCLFLIPTMIYTGIKNKIYHILLYLPLFYVLRFLGSFVFLLCFVKVVLSVDLRMKWNKVVRY